MPTAPDNHDAHNYAECIRERLPRALRQLREARKLSMYALEKKSGVPREMIRCIEEGVAIPTFPAGAKLAHRVRLKMAPLLDKIDELIHALRR